MRDQEQREWRRGYAEKLGFAMVDYQRETVETWENGRKLETKQRESELFSLKQGGVIRAQIIVQLKPFVTVTWIVGERFKSANSFEEALKTVVLELAALANCRAK